MVWTCSQRVDKNVYDACLSRCKIRDELGDSANDMFWEKRSDPLSLPMFIDIRTLFVQKRF